jgi:hypothetical protein
MSIPLSQHVYQQIDHSKYSPLSTPETFHYVAVSHRLFPPARREAQTRISLLSAAPFRGSGHSARGLAHSSTITALLFISSNFPAPPLCSLFAWSGIPLIVPGPALFTSSLFFWFSLLNSCLPRLLRWAGLFIGLPQLHVSVDQLPSSSTAPCPASLLAVLRAALPRYLTGAYFSDLNFSHAHGSACRRLPSTRGFSPRTPASA